MMKVRKPNRIVGVGGQAYPPPLPQGSAVSCAILKKEVAHLLYLNNSHENWRKSNGNHGDPIMKSDRYVNHIRVSLCFQ